MIELLKQLFTAINNLFKAFRKSTSAQVIDIRQKLEEKKNAIKDKGERPKW